jgi:hypothetical protein
MESEYPSFKYNGESITIIPGHYFSKKDLKNRLHLMGIESTIIVNRVSTKKSILSIFL